MATRNPPKKDDVVTGSQVGDSFANALNNAGALVSHHDRREDGPISPFMT